MSASPIRVHLTWEPGSQFEVDHGADGITVRAHAGLSASQVSQACDSLGEHGPQVYQAWCRAVGMGDVT